MGYGGLPNFTEYDAAGHVLFDATLGPGVQDYRTYLAPWSGQPKTLPALAAQPPARRRDVEASWNGATRSPPGRSWPAARPARWRRSRPRPGTASRRRSR